MKTLLFDTETNGLPKGMTLEAQPDMLQIAAILLEGNRPVGHLSCFCDPQHHGAELTHPERAVLQGGRAHARPGHGRWAPVQTRPRNVQQSRAPRRPRCRA